MGSRGMSPEAPRETSHVARQDLRRLRAALRGNAQQKYPPNARNHLYRTETIVESDTEQRGTYAIHSEKIFHRLLPPDHPGVGADPDDLLCAPEREPVLPRLQGAAEGGQGQRS